MTPADRQALAVAFSVRLKANEWPRCGQDWPQSPTETQAEAVLSAAGGYDEAGVLLGLFQSPTAARAAAAAAAAARDAEIAADQASIDRRPPAEQALLRAAWSRGMRVAARDIGHDRTFRCLTLPMGDGRRLAISTKHPEDGVFERDF